MSTEVRYRQACRLAARSRPGRTSRATALPAHNRTHARRIPHRPRPRSRRADTEQRLTWLGDRSTPGRTGFVGKEEDYGCGH